MNKTLFAAFLACLAAFGAAEAVNVNWIGKGDLSNTFGDPANFGYWGTVDGKPTFINRLPDAGSVVYLQNNEVPDMHVRDSDAALASQVNFYLSGGKVYWDVTTNCTISGSMGGSGGEFIKKGMDTTLQLANASGQFVYDARYTVAEGTLKLQNFVGKTCPYAAFVSGYCTVSNGATLVMCNADSSLETAFRWLKCYGLFTNENPSVRHVLTTRYEGGVASLMAGPVGGNIWMRIGAGEFNITSTENTFSFFKPRSPATTNQTVVGIMKFGMKGEATSSIGPTETLASDVGQVAAAGPLYRYLGTGETTDKDLEITLDSKWATMEYNLPSGFDGGPHGGAIFTGLWKNSGSYMQILRLTGTNAVPCQYSGTYSMATANGIHYSPHIVKDGSGVWRFNENSKRTWAYALGLSAAFSIEEGTLEFTTLGEVGENCALGTAGDLHDKYIGTYDASRNVSWAYSFGTTNAAGAAEKEGTLEFIGTETAFASRRPVSLLGNGRLKNSGTAVFSLRGVSARAAGEHILTLDGSNTMANAVAEVSDGVAGAHVSIVKEGDGKWFVKGNSTFSGDIVVKKGDLFIDANTNRFDWFRITFRKAANTFVQPFQVALYDADGVRQNKGLSWPSTWTTFGNAVYCRHEGCDLNPGEIFYGRSGAFYINLYSGIPQYTSDSLTSNSGNAGNAAVAPDEAAPFTWLPIIMRLKATAKEVASFDICQAKGSDWSVRSPTSYMVEGSQDGLNWQLLNDTPYDAGWTLPGCTNWYSNGKTFVPGEVRKLSDGCGFAIAGHPEVSSLPNVRSVRVDSGATLKTEYENVGVIRGLKVSVVGGGTIDGFKFAASGAVDLVDVPEKGAFHMDVNIVNDGGTKANIADWPVTINGQVEARRSARFTGSGFDILEYGLIMIVK